MSSAANQLLDFVLLRLQQMTVANGYTHEFVQIKRATQQPFDLFDDLPAVNYYSSGSIVESRQHSYQHRDLNVVFEAYAKTQDDPFTDVASKLGDELETVLHRTPTSPQPGDANEPFIYNGSTAVGEIYIDDVVYAIGEGQSPYCGAVITARIRYQILTGSPSTLQEI